MVHQHSKVCVFVHMVWKTIRRQALLADPQVERAVYRCIEQEAQRAKCPALEIGGTANHVHLLFPLYATKTIAQVAQLVKGVSSNFANDQLDFHGSFAWNENYGTFRVSERDLDMIRAYIANQKQQHRDKTQVDEWETTYENVEYPDPE